MAVLTTAEHEEALAQVAAERLTVLLADAVATRGSAVVALTGGSTPQRLYACLADHAQPWREQIDWRRCHLFWGDERHVPPDHEDSNFGMAQRTLIAHVPVPASQVHRMRGELPAEDAARDYEQTLRDGFRAAGRGDQIFDVMLLGLGEDAHIASIFPGSPLLTAALAPARRDTRAAAVWAPHLNAWRITLTPAAILDARAIVMLVAGSAKADAVHAAVEAPLDVDRAPAQLLRQATDRVEWLIDRGAAARLTAR